MTKDTPKDSPLYWPQLETLWFILSVLHFSGTAGYPLCRFAYRLHKNPLPLAPPDTYPKTPTQAQQSQLILETAPAAKWLGQGPLTIGDAGARESSIQMFQQGWVNYFSPPNYVQVFGLRCVRITKGRQLISLLREENVALVQSPGRALSLLRKIFQVLLVVRLSWDIIVQ